MKCPVCLKGFSVTGENVPMVLDCSHTVCKSCLQYKLGPAHRCPTCKRSNETKGRINYAVRDLVASQEKVEKCENCDQHQASEYCMQCNVRMCYMCTDFIHNMRALKSHTRLPIAQMPPDDMCGVSDDLFLS